MPDSSSYAAPLQALILNKIDKTTSTIAIEDSTGFYQPIYHVSYNKRKHTLEVRYTSNPNMIVGTITFHTLSSKIEIFFRGLRFTMARKDLLGSAHHFVDPTGQLGEVKWKETSFLGSGVAMLDGRGRTLMRYRKRMPEYHGASGFEVYARMDQTLMDLAVVTGLGSSEYLAQSNRDWDEVGKEVLNGFIGGGGD